MESDNVVSVSIAVVAAVFILTVGGCTARRYHEDTLRIEALAKAGANPIDIYCVVNNESSTQGACALRAAK